MEKTGQNGKEHQALFSSITRTMNEATDGKIVSGMSFTRDNYKNDQVIQILNDEYYVNGKPSIQRGIFINQYPEGADLDVKN